MPGPSGVCGEESGMAMRCVAAFAAYRNGAPVIVNVGEVLPDDDEVIKGREGLFEPLDAHLARRSGVEQATAAPGEKRSVTARRASRKSG